MKTLLVSTAVDPASSEGLRDLRDILQRANVQVLFALRGTCAGVKRHDSRPDVVVITDSSIAWQSSLLGQLERVLAFSKRVLASLVSTQLSGFARRATFRLQVEARLAATHARRLDAARSPSVEALFDGVDPDLVLSLQPHKREELSLLAAAQCRRTPVIAMIDDEAALAIVSPPAGRFMRLLVTDERLEAAAFRCGAHPSEVEIVDCLSATESSGGAIARVVLDQLGLVPGRPLPSKSRGGRRRPRVLMVGSEGLPIPPSKGGAVELYVHEVSRRLVDEFDVVTCSPGPVLDSESAVERRELESGDDYLPSVVRLLEHESYDIVHIFNRPWFVSPIASAAGDALVLLNLHNDHLKWMTQEDRAEIVDRLDSIVTNGEFLRRRTIDRVAAASGKVASIHSGVDVCSFHPSLRASPDTDALREAYRLEAGPLLVYVGRISPEKGTHLLPTILEVVRRRDANAQLLMVGSVWFGETTSNEYLRQVESKARVVGEAIRFAGFVPYAGIPRVLAAADALVAPGQWEEPFGRFIIEALAAGVPLITSPLGGTTEAAINGRTALVVRDFRRPEAHADAVCRVLSDSELRARLTSNGRRLVEQRFTWNHTAREFGRLYSKLLAATVTA